MLSTTYPLVSSVLAAWVARPATPEPFKTSNTHRDLSNLGEGVGDTVVISVGVTTCFWAEGWACQKKKMPIEAAIMPTVKPVPSMKSR